jgi:gamma-glutamyltranspeptidase/glutathione hydrolase
VHARVAFDWATAAGRLNESKTARESYLFNGRPPAVGHNFTQPALGKTLRQLAAQGPSAFYEGGIAADMVTTLRSLGGLHTEADFAAGIASAEFVQPISAKWRGTEVFECPPNGAGLLALMLLGILEGFETPREGPLSAERLHRHVEAARLVFRDRDAFLADPSQVDVPVERLMSPQYLAELRAAISDTGSMPKLPPAGASVMLPPHKDTVYLCVVDRDGNACSFINSLFATFGSCIYAENAGVLLHNRGFSFRLEEGQPNCIAPGKRPMHTIIPGMVMKDGQPLMPFGVMGGHFQPMGQTLFLTNHFEFGLDIQEALDLPRLFPRNEKLEVERGISRETVARLVALGHQCEQVSNPHGGGQAILIDRERGWFVGGSDPRKDGCALGY